MTVPYLFEECMIECVCILKTLWRRRFTHARLSLLAWSFARVVGKPDVSGLCRLCTLKIREKTTLHTSVLSNDSLSTEKRGKIKASSRARQLRWPLIFLITTKRSYSQDRLLSFRRTIVRSYKRKKKFWPSNFLSSDHNTAQQSRLLSLVKRFE